LQSHNLLQALLPDVSPAALFFVPPALLLPCIFMDSVRRFIASVTHCI
jgi:hypothetical protein